MRFRWDKRVYDFRYTCQLLVKTFRNNGCGGKKRETPTEKLRPQDLVVRA